MFLWLGLGLFGDAVSVALALPVSGVCHTMKRDRSGNHETCPRRPPIALAQSTPGGLGPQHQRRMPPCQLPQFQRPPQTRNVSTAQQFNRQRDSALVNSNRQGASHNTIAMQLNMWDWHSTPAGQVPPVCYASSIPRHDVGHAHATFCPCHFCPSREAPLQEAP